MMEYDIALGLDLTVVTIFMLIANQVWNEIQSTELLTEN